MGYETDLMRELNRLEPASANNQAWAKKQLAEFMGECGLDREQALEILKTHVPTVYGWL